MKMKAQNRTSNLRIIFSAIALVAFVLFTLCDNLIVNEYTSYHTYGWRLGVLNDLFLSVPYIALLVFSIMERKMKRISKRAFVAGIFVIYLAQALLMAFSNGMSEFSIFCCGYVGRGLTLVTFFITVRIVMLLLVPMARKSILKLYSIGMIAFFGYSMVTILISDYLHTAHAVAVNAIALSIDIMFHIALFFFSDLLDEKNKFTSLMESIGVLIYSIFDKTDEDIDYYAEFGSEFGMEESELSNQTKRFDYETAYKKVLITALNEDDFSFLNTHSFFRDLSKEAISNGDKYYSADEYSRNLTLLSQKINAINSAKPGFISNAFANYIDLLLNEKDDPTFRMDVVTFAKLLFGEKTSTWIEAVKDYTEYRYSSKEEVP